jgi:hypothetical protein
MSMDKKQTALQQFIDKITSNHDKHFKDFYKAEIEEALQMEREQKIEFAKEVFANRYNQVFESLDSVANETYNETYGSEK